MNHRPGSCNRMLRNGKPYITQANFVYINVSYACMDVFRLFSVIVLGRCINVHIYIFVNTA